MFFSVFTPTYNRAHCLGRVYNSLLTQVYTNFEWVIIDDGSLDNTKDLVASWIKESKFKIKYYYQQNQGKHIAWNKALELAEGKYFLCADSDDSFLPETLQEFHNALVKCGNKIIGVGCLCQDQYGSLIGNKYPHDEFIATINEMYFKHGGRGEKWFCIKMKILLKFKFPNLTGIPYYPEVWLWSKIPGNMVFLNSMLRVYYINDNQEQLTNTRTSPVNYLAAKIVLNSLFQYFFYNPWLFIKQALKVARFAFLFKDSVTKVMHDIKPFGAKLLVLLFYPCGFLWSKLK